jgi:hypothetical protein
MLKCCARLGYFPDLEQVPGPVVDRVRGTIPVSPGTPVAFHSERSAERYRSWIREYLGSAYDEAVWCWTVRQRVRPDYADCRLTLSLFPEVPAQGVRRRLTLVFAPGPDRIVSNSYFEAGTVMRLPDRAWLNLYEPGTVRRLLDAAALALDTGPSVQNLEVDGWPYFADVVDHANTAESHT